MIGILTGDLDGFFAGEVPNPLSCFQVDFGIVK